MLFGLGNRLLPVKIIRREQNCRCVNFEPGPGVKTGSMLVCRPCDCTPGNLNNTSIREKSRGVYLQIG